MSVELSLYNDSYENDSEKLDYSEYSILSVDVSYNSNFECYELIYKLKSYLDDSVVYGSISTLLKNKDDIKLTINQYKKYIEKIDKFIPYDTYNRMNEIIEKRNNNKDLSNDELTELYEEFEGLNNTLNDNYNAQFVERINNSTLLEFYDKTITLKISSNDGIISILRSDFDIIYTDYDYKVFKFIEVLINTKKLFEEIIKQLNSLI